MGLDQYIYIIDKKYKPSNTKEFIVKWGDYPYYSGTLLCEWSKHYDLHE